MTIRSSGGAGLCGRRKMFEHVTFIFMAFDVVNH